MKKVIALCVFVLAGCATFSDVIVPELRFRTLQIAEDQPGLIYRWTVCEKKNIFGGCKQWVEHVEFYDFTDKAVRDQLRAIGFVAKVRDPVIAKEKEGKENEKVGGVTVAPFNSLNILRN